MVIVIVISYTIVVTVAEFPSYINEMKNDPEYRVEWIMKDFDVRWF